MRKPQSLNGAQPENCASVFRAPFATARRTKGNGSAGVERLRLKNRPRAWVASIHAADEANDQWLPTLMKLLLTAHGYGYTVRPLWQASTFPLSSKVIRFSGDWKDSRHGDIGGVGEPVAKRSYRRQRCQVLGKSGRSPVYFSSDFVDEIVKGTSSLPDLEMLGFKWQKRPSQRGKEADMDSSLFAEYTLWGMLY